MSTDTETIRNIQTSFAALQSEKKTLEGKRTMTLREAVRALFPTLQRMKKRGFDNKELAQKLNEYGVSIKPATLAKYLHEMEKEILNRKAAATTRKTTDGKKQNTTQLNETENCHATATTSEME